MADGGIVAALATSDAPISAGFVSDPPKACIVVITMLSRTHDRKFWLPPIVLLPSMSESTRGSSLLAISDECGPAVLAAGPEPTPGLIRELPSRSESTRGSRALAARLLCGP